MPVPNTLHPRETLRNFVNGGSSHPEVREFKQQCRWICSVGTLNGLAAWVDARDVMGLFDTPELQKASLSVLCSISRWEALIDAERQEREAANHVPWETRMQLINEREKQRRANCPPVGHRITRRKLSLQERMAAGAELHGFDD